MSFEFEDDDFNDIDLDSLMSQQKPPKKEKAVRLTKKGLPDKRRESSRKNITLAQCKVASYLAASRKIPPVTDDDEPSTPMGAPVPPPSTPLPSAASSPCGASEVPVRSQCGTSEAPVRAPVITSEHERAPVSTLPPLELPPPAIALVTPQEMKELREQLYLLQNGFTKMTEGKALKQAMKEKKEADSQRQNNAQIQYNNTLRRQVIFKR